MSALQCAPSYDQVAHGDSDPPNYTTADFGKSYNFWQSSFQAEKNLLHVENELQTAEAKLEVALKRVKSLKEKRCAAITRGDGVRSADAAETV